MRLSKRNGPEESLEQKLHNPNCARVTEIGRRVRQFRKRDAHRGATQKGSGASAAMLGANAKLKGKLNLSPPLDDDLGKYALPDSGQLSGKAVICTAHLMLLQNPKAVLSTSDWVPYLCLVRDWCMKQEFDGVRYYWHPGFSAEDVEPSPGRLN